MTLGMGTPVRRLGFLDVTINSNLLEARRSPAGRVTWGSRPVQWRIRRLRSRLLERHLSRISDREQTAGLIGTYSSAEMYSPTKGIQHVLGLHLPGSEYELRSWN